MSTKPRARAKTESAQSIIDKLERWTPVRVHRSKLIGAEYNPRKITDAARLRLKKLLEKNGILSPVTWNVRSGRVVGGHQRLRILDALAGSADYELTVAQVDLSDYEEKQANLALNNRMAQGDDDLEKLAQVFKDAPGLDLDATGFDTADIYHMFGEGGLDSLEAEKVQELGQKTREYVERFDTKQKQASRVKDRDDIDFYTVLVFKNNAQRLAFHESLGLVSDSFIDGRTMLDLFKVRSGGEE